MTPKIIGICGGSASGKSTLANQLQKQLGVDLCSVISMDNYYIDFVSIGHNPQEVNYDHPASFDTKRLVEDLNKLKETNSTSLK